jgi:hypothetical protein
MPFPVVNEGTIVRDSAMRLGKLMRKRLIFLKDSDDGV